MEGGEGRVVGAFGGSDCYVVRVSLGINFVGVFLFVV